jgi:ATP-dependent RNA helicase UAP56/SUB2
MDVLCVAKSGTGKTTVFVLATLQQLQTVENQVYVLVVCHSRELAIQIYNAYECLSKHMTTIKVKNLLHEFGKILLELKLF